MAASTASASRRCSARSQRPSGPGPAPYDWYRPARSTAVTRQPARASSGPMSEKSSLDPVIPGRQSTGVPSSGPRSRAHRWAHGTAHARCRAGGATTRTRGRSPGLSGRRPVRRSLRRRSSTPRPSGTGGVLRYCSRDPTDRPSPTPRRPLTPYRRMPAGRPPRRRRLRHLAEATSPESALSTAHMTRPMSAINRLVLSLRPHESSQGKKS